MSDDFMSEPFPRGPLLGAGALVVFTLIAVGAARIGQISAETAFATEPVAVVSLHFADRGDGGVRVIDSATQEEIDAIEPGSGGFIRQTLRSLVRARRADAIGADMPFELRRYADNRVELYDTATGQSIFLDAFGATNSAAFARLIEAAGGKQQ